MLLEIRVKNMKKIFMIFCGVIIGIFVIQYESYAINIARTDKECETAFHGEQEEIAACKANSKETIQEWYYKTGTVSNDNFSIYDLVIAGRIYNDGERFNNASDEDLELTRGTKPDEHGIVLFMARDIVANGGYFCPYQLQCSNTSNTKRTWTQYYEPKNFLNSQCVWLCKNGYYGNKCEETTSSGSTTFNNDCDNSNFSKETGMFSELGMNTTISSVSKEEEITGFDTGNESTGNDSGYYKEYDVVLAAVKFLDHGIVALPVKIHCGVMNWPDNDSFVDFIRSETNDKGTILCAQGYKPDDSNLNCVPINSSACGIDSFPFCNGFDKSKFNESIHYKDIKGDCVKYFCEEPGTAFKSTTDTTCVECSNGGPDPNNGTCISCNIGQYFDEDDGICKTAVAYSKSDMQYGKGETKNTVPLDEQCWLIATPEEYAECVKNDGKRPYSPSNSTQIMTQSIF